MRILGVAQVNRYLRDVFEMDATLLDLWVEGEISNFRRAASGHCYFTLKDATSQIACAWFARHIPSRLPLPVDGQQSLVHGRVSIYEQRGEYQIIVSAVRAGGAGADQLRFEALRARLEAEGLFDETRKRPLPRFPRRVGLVTSETGAVLHDIVQVLSRRFPDVELVVVPTLVQGDGAVEGIVDALAALEAWGRADVVIIARGGGSSEDLSAFNDERVARAIFGSRVPVVAGIGHGTDYTIADLVADIRAPTPSAAAELVVPDVRDTQTLLADTLARLESVIGGVLSARRSDVDDLSLRLERRSPTRTLAQRRLAIDTLVDRAFRQTRATIDVSRATLDGERSRLDALSPLAVLGRGFSIVYDARTGRVLRRASDSVIGAPIAVRLASGSLDARVEAIDADGSFATAGRLE
ncbi:MAG: exodeoxyribonuclease VII large subunit [Chloroflexota bacterium]|nr:MAG: exodeoxyribonuclease VII large subunit [Chloroflexota bacterium]